MLCGSLMPSSISKVDVVQQSAGENILLIKPTVVASRNLTKQVSRSFLPNYKATTVMNSKFRCSQFV